MGFGATRSRRQQAARKHAQRERTCRCGRTIRGNAYFRHRAVCDAAKERNKS